MKTRIAGWLALALALVPLAAATAAAAASSSAGAYDIARCGNTSGRILLTFDDWAYNDPYRATRVGTYLRDRQVRAAFFLVNEFAEDYPDIVTTLRQQGHWVANHTYAHRQLTSLSDDEVSEEIGNGVRSHVLRPPYGDFGEREESIPGSLGYRLCTWTVDTLDWEADESGYRGVSGIRSLVRQAPYTDKYGGVILGHLDYHFPDALPGLIEDLSADGFQPCLNDGPVGEAMPHPLDCD
ncbi:polysaccharide deacetylase family protein [Streptomyces sp. 8N706]|uniref:polysaccharide deacetylase family protein n=1 Tax=Streptomyces sp. 8N706 TaxID=3457416 RepID=UPI003FD08264